MAVELWLKKNINLLYLFQAFFDLETGIDGTVYILVQTTAFKKKRSINLTPL